MIVLIDYNAGNTRSVENALKRLGSDCVISNDAHTIRQASQVILPGVGEAASAMAYLKERGMDSLIRNLKQPVLGICLGMQLLCRESEEGDTACLGIFDAAVKRFPPLDIVPHMGWNTLQNTRGVLTQGLGEEDDVYFVHSYYATLCAHTTASCSYILPFSAVMEHNNFYGVQFHPEKSASAGERILSNFLTL